MLDFMAYFMLRFQQNIESYLWLYTDKYFSDEVWFSYYMWSLYYKPYKMLWKWIIHSEAMYWMSATYQVPGYNRVCDRRKRNSCIPDPHETAGPNLLNGAKNNAIHILTKYLPCIEI